MNGTTPGPWWPHGETWIEGKDGVMVARAAKLADLRETRANQRLLAAAPQLLRALLDLMGAYERGVRSACTPEQLKASPWRVQEFVAAEDAVFTATVERT